MLIELGALVKTDRGEGFLIGHTPGSLAGEDHFYSVQLLDRTVCHSFRAPQFQTIELVDNFPINHPDIPAGLKEYVTSKLPKPRPTIIDEPIILPPVRRSIRSIFSRRKMA